MNAVIAILVFVSVFAAIYRGLTDRHTAVLAGAVVMLSYGMTTGFYSLEMAVNAIYFETLVLIFGMSLISATLGRSGVFSLIAERTASYSLGNGWWVLVLFSLVTYGFSLLVNNLAAMVVIVPVTLTLCWRLALNPVPVLIAEIVASNLGGASTMVGDFPNMIISSAGNLHFLDFIGGMMVPCLILLAAMLMFFQSRRNEIHAPNSGPRRDAIKEPAADAIPNDHRLDSGLMKLGLLILGVTLVGFLLSDAIDVRPAWVALVAGLATLAFGRFDGETLFASCGGNDILFFSGLFVMVGGLAAAGVLNGFVEFIRYVSGGYGLFQLLALMWMAAVVTIFLNAGAATAFFIPVAADINAVVTDPTVWWALSLGVLAGSSGALTGATAGSVTASHLERFTAANPEMTAYVPAGGGLDFKGYLGWGLPIMGMFLVLSSIYIALVAR